MSSPPILDFDKLLSPIAGSNPAGVDPRSDSSPTSGYYTVKDARSAARAAERQAMLGGDETQGSPPDWRAVFKPAIDMLAVKAKDLEITAYLIEALVRLNGFVGLRDGFRLTRLLIEKFWDQLYPLPDEDGIDTRIAPLTGLNGDGSEGTLAGPLSQVPITGGSSAGPYSQAAYQQGVTLDALQDEKARATRVERGAVTLEMFRQAVAETPASFFQGLVEDLTECQEEFRLLGAILDEKCGPRSPPTSSIRAALETCMDTIRDVARDKLASAAPVEEAVEGAEPSSGTTPAAAPAPPGTIRTREDAFIALNRVADFFRRTEPHSPVSYALAQVIRWGKLPLPQLLAELVPERAARDYISKLVGVVIEDAPK